MDFSKFWQSVPAGTVVFSDNSVTATQGNDLSIFCTQSLAALPQPYFEIQVEDDVNSLPSPRHARTWQGKRRPESAGIVIGLVPKDFFKGHENCTKSPSLLGSRARSRGAHAYPSWGIENKDTYPGFTWLHPYGSGDLIGCGLDHEGRLFFTRNGKVTTSHNVKLSSASVYPVVGLLLKEGQKCMYPPFMSFLLSPFGNPNFFFLPPEFPVCLLYRGPRFSPSSLMILSTFSWTSPVFLVPPRIFAVTSSFPTSSHFPPSPSLIFFSVVLSMTVHIKMTSTSIPSGSPRGEKLSWYPQITNPLGQIKFEIPSPPMYEMGLLSLPREIVKYLVTRYTTLFLVVNPTTPPMCVASLTSPTPCFQEAIFQSQL